jgi:uncharacterized tellurite resistance protein B-like protein
MISLAVANAMAIVKNHVLDLNMEVLRKDFTVDEADREALVNSAYDATYDFVSLYDFVALLSSMAITVPGLCIILLLYAIINYY